MIWLALAACGGGEPAGAPDGSGRGPRASIDELQILKRAPQACQALSDCPSGSHCNEESGRCTWSCFADSDCGDDTKACDLRGQCVGKAASQLTAGLRTSSISSQLAADHPTCLAKPLQQKLDALAELSTNPSACFEDLDCPCGAYCSNDGTCRFDCTFDAPAQGPFCSPGDVCSPEGRCVLPSGSDDPSRIVELEAAPEIIRGNTATAAVIVPVELRVRAKLSSHLSTAVNATIGINVVSRTGGPTALSPRVRCATGAPLAASCQLPAGWVFGADPDPLRSSARSIWVELPQTAVADEWSITARSEWAEAPVALIAVAQPVVTPPRPTGHFTGTIAWPQPGGDPLVIPVEADVSANRVALFEPSRLILPHGHAILSKAAADTTSYAWLRSDHATLGPQEASAFLDVDTWVFDGAKESITSSIRLTLGNGPAPAQLTLSLDRDRDTTHATCSAGSSCGTGKYCNTEIGMCLPGTRSNTTILLDGFAPSSLLFSAQREQWAPAVSGLRVNHLTVLSGNDIIGMERAMCFLQPSQTTPGRIASSNANLGGANPAGDAMCSVPGNASDLPQQVFPYANRTTAVTVNGSGTETFNLLDTCLEELAVTPSSPYTAANLLQPKQCVSLARFMLAMGAPTPTTTNYPQTARRRLENQLTRQWVSLHALIARGAVQEGEYDEAIGGTLDQPMHQRLGQAVDVLEKGWRLLMKSKRTDEANLQAAQQHDYRSLGRPVVHWTLNQNLDGSVPDTENNHRLYLWNVPTDSRNAGYLQIQNSPWMTCRTETDVALPSHHFSLVAWLGVSGTPTTYDLITKYNGADQFRIRVYNVNADVRRVEVQFLTMISGAYSLTSSASFQIPAEPGYYGFVADGGTFRIHRMSRDSTNGSRMHTYAPISTFGGGPRWGGPGRVAIGCQSATGLVLADEISLWDRPLPPETLQAFSLNYLTPTGGQQPFVDSLPARNLTLQATDEQAQGLAVHLVDGLAAHMELLSAYVRSERSEMFGECGANNVGPARTRVLDRVGRGLRFATMIENDARDLVALAGATTASWITRYNAAIRLLAGKRAEVVTQMGLATRCENPLGITDADLPLYHGTEVGESARFFASSRFLTSQAKEQVQAATTELNLARNAWQQQRLSAFQNNVLAPAEKAERLRKIEQEYEGVLRRLCGVPASGTVLAAFRAGTMTANNCFLRRERPECANAETMSLRQLPSACLRGEIGEQVLSIQAAEIDVRNADNAYNRAIDQYDAEMAYCTRREDHQQETLEIQQKHNAHMQKLREERRSKGFFGGFVKAMVGMAVGALAGQPTIAIGAWLDGVGLIAGQPEQQAAEDEQQAQEAHNLVMQARAAALDLMACFHGADNQKFAIDAAGDVLTRAFHDTKGTMLRLENQQSELKALVSQAIGDLDFEAQMPRVLPHHHYWVDDHIDAYRRHFRYAQRLTYLALRAFEYESQQSLGLGSSVLSARVPGPLMAAVLVLEARTAPMQGEAGFVVGEFNPVMSLRDDILRLGTRDTPPGFPQLSSIEALRAFLASDASKIYSNGLYVGRGIRFSLRPQPWAQFSCAERIWRITTALQVEGSPVNNARLLLWQENSFGSQRCRSNEHADLKIARIRPEKNLLVGDEGNFEGGDFIRPLRYTAMEVTGLPNTSREDLENRAEGLHSGFSGRGLYANYVLLFPSEQFDNPGFLSTVKDVLFRFDIVEVTDISGDPD